MKYRILTVMLALALSAAMVSNANAGDEFEDGFKTELGAISARAAVGLGAGLIGGIFHGGPVYASPPPVYYRPYRPAPYVVRPVYVAPYPRWRHHRHYHEHHVYHHRPHRCW